MTIAPGNGVPLSVDVTHRRKDHAFVVLRVLGCSKVDLFEVARARRLLRFFAGMGEYGEQKRGKKAKNGKDNEQLNQRKAMFSQCVHVFRTNGGGKTVRARDFY